MAPWSFLHICDMQPGSPRSFRFNQRNMDNWQTAYRQIQDITDVDLMLVGGDPTLGFYRFDVTDAEITPTFIPLTEESQSTEGYGPGGHPRPEERDYSLAWEK